MVSAEEAKLRAQVLGPVIAGLRRRRGWDQALLAKETNLSQSTVSRIERGEASPTYHDMQAIAGAFKMTVGQLEGYIDDAIRVAQQAARATTPKAQSSSGPFWWAMLGSVALAALVAFAVAVVLDSDQAPKKPGAPRP